MFSLSCVISLHFALFLFSCTNFQNFIAEVGPTGSKRLILKHYVTTTKSFLLVYVVETSCKDQYDILLRLALL